LASSALTIASLASSCLTADRPKPAKRRRRG
jgi:hypothetical protein